MCEECVRVVKEVFPNLTDEDDLSDMLLGFTGFPFRQGEELREDLEYLRDHGEAAAGERIWAKIDEAMRIYHENNPDQTPPS